MAKKVEIEVDVKGGDKVKGLGQEIRDLNKQLRQTPEGTKEWSQIYNKIDDLKDKMKSAKNTSADFIDSLEGAGGPLGMLGKGLNSVKVATQSWGAALKATGIGLIVAAIGMLVAAFSQTEGSMKKLQPLMIMLEKLFGGLVEAFQPILDAFLSLAMKILPPLITYIKNFYGSLMALFTLVKEAGVGIGKILKGIFTLDTKALEEGFDQIKGSWEKAKESFNQFGDNFDKGYAKQTKTQKENAAKSKEIADKLLAEKLKRMDAEDKLDEAKMEKMKAEALAVATTEQQKYDVEKAFADKIYQLKSKELQDKMALYAKDSVEYKNLQADKLKLDTDYISKTTELKTKQKDITDKSNKELLDSEISALDLKKANGEVKEFEYQESLYNIKKKYLTDKKDLDANEIAFTQAKLADKKKIKEEERLLLFSALQDQIDVLDRANALRDDDFLQDNVRLEEKKLKLQEQRQLALDAAKEDRAKQLEIDKKYADDIYNVDIQITNNAKAQQQARTELLNQYMDLVGSFGSFLQQAAGKNKTLAKAGLLLEQAAGIAKIVINTQVNAAKAGYLSPKGIAEIVAGAIGVAVAIAATVKGIRQIDASDSGSTSTGGGQSGPQSNGMGEKRYADGGIVSGPGTSKSDSIPARLSNGEAVMTAGAVTAFAPLLSTLNQMGGGTSFSKGAAGMAFYDNPKSSYPSDFVQSPVQVIKTYVVEGELTSQQQKQARLKDLSTI